MGGLTDRELRERLISNPDAGWRSFVDQYSARLLQLIDQCGVRDRDDQMDLYVHICERLAADDCARLRKHDPGKGALAAWLGPVVRNLLVDWVRSQKGRKRLFATIRALPDIDQRVFEHYYWRRQTPAEMADFITDASGRGIGLSAVFASLERVERALTDRQRVDLMAMTARSAAALSLEDEEGEPIVPVATDEPGPEAALAGAQQREWLAAAMRQLPAEDRVILSMRFFDGLTLPEIKRALHLPALSIERVTAIIDALRRILEAREGSRS